ELRRPGLPLRDRRVRARRRGRARGRRRPPLRGLDAGPRRPAPRPAAGRRPRRHRDPGRPARPRPGAVRLAAGDDGSGTGLYTTEELYRLLPAVYRIRDAEEGGVLRELIDVIAGQVNVIAESLEQLYDDQFVETCADWVAPYIGDLVGYRTLHGVVPAVASPRADVANTIRYRRRKGTVSVLEQLAHDVTAWPAHA